MKHKIVQQFVFAVFLFSLSQSAHAEAIQMLPPVQSSTTSDVCAGGQGNKILTWDGSSSIKCMQNAVLDASGNLGVGTSSPQSKLDVRGGVKLGSDASVCSGEKAGTAQWTGTKLMLCDGHAWVPIPFGAPYVIVGGVEGVFGENTGTFGYCRLQWGAVTSCSGSGVTCSIGTPITMGMSHDDIASGEDVSPGKFISSGGGAHVNQYGCLLSFN